MMDAVQKVNIRTFDKIGFLVFFDGKGLFFNIKILFLLLARLFLGEGNFTKK
jgi:hypothetical protein